MAPTVKIHLTVNGERREVECALNESLLQVLRREGYHSVKNGCSSGWCGTCAVLLNGHPVASCQILAPHCDDAEIVTVEGLRLSGDKGQGTGDRDDVPGWSLHPLQEAFLDTGATQCGFCSPGMLVSAKALLDENPNPNEDEIRRALAGNLCRCTGYVKIIEAVRLAARRMSRKE